MKLILLAAAVAFAVPAVAQSTDDQAPTQDQSMPAQGDQSATPAQDQSSMPAQGDQSTMPAQDQSAMPASGAAPTAGGYAPTTPPMSGPAQPGANVVFTPSASPTQAFPPPPPKASYPPCKSGQTDGCTERENARGEGLHPQHRR